MGERLPRSSDAVWRVEICGAVTRPCTLPLADLQALPQSVITLDIHCVTRWSKPDVRFTGVPLADLLRRAEPVPAARFISFVARSDRWHSTSLPLDEAIELGTLAALTAEDAPLPSQHGGPVRLVVPRRYFYKSLKWLERIELLESDRLGHWEATAGYHNHADPWQEERYIAAGISKAEAAAILAQRDVSKLDLRSIDARKRDLSGLVARNALLRDADFRGGNLRAACFDGANLTNAHLQDADLREASFRDADLEGANFSRADLRGACFLGASLVAATFAEAGTLDAQAPAPVVVDRRTQFSSTSLEDLTPDQQMCVRAALDQAARDG
ncbi:MAG: molybdopterin-dependent oxidoreductase [Pirellulales bacterium]